MLTFIHQSQDYPEKRVASKRALDFKEIYEEFQIQKAAEQASRCSQCGIPFCQTHCPLGNHIPDWLKLAAEGRMQEAYHISSLTNMMPEICGRICPQDRLCEGNCVIEQSGHGAVTIGSLEKYITENAWDEGWVMPIYPPQELEQSVGIIGAGPAGLVMAEMLRRKGYQVFIYDRYDRAGGLLTYGIPSFKLEKDVVKRRIDYLKGAGVQFVLGVMIGVDIAFETLQEKHDAIFIATGVYKARTLDTLPISDDMKPIPALEYLTASNRKSFGDEVVAFETGYLNAHGKKVVVIGGGDTAMDCVRTAIRQGAEKVTCLYRRDKKNMMGSQKEVHHAEEEGVVFEYCALPKALLEKHILVTKVKLGKKDASGQSIPEEIPDSGFTIEADMVIEALGFEPEDLPTLFGTNSLKVTRWGTLRVDSKTGQTSVKGVFAGGDIVRGASLVVWAIKDGRDISEHIDNYLKGIE